MTDKSSILIINIDRQEMEYYENDIVKHRYIISSGKNGVGEKLNSECTPRGLHKINAIIGLEHQINSVFVARNWTGEIYTEQLGTQFPERDWILTRILRLEGLESGVNQGGDIDTFARYIYIHGTPDSIQLGKPGSRGCIRMNNLQIIELANQVTTNTLVYIK